LSRRQSRQGCVTLHAWLCHHLHVARHALFVTHHVTHVTRHASHVTRHTSHVTHHTWFACAIACSNCCSTPPPPPTHAAASGPSVHATATCRQVYNQQTRLQSQLTCTSSCVCHTSPAEHPCSVAPVLPVCACYTSHVTRHTSHVTRHTLQITHHASHVTRHTSHVTRHLYPLVLLLLREQLRRQPSTLACSA
jgi:hypothetical protein